MLMIVTVEQLAAFLERNEEWQCKISTILFDQPFREA
jgi:hypothetical protein